MTVKTPTRWPACSSRWRRLLHGECGATILEFSLTGSLLFLAIVGLMKMSLAVYTYHYISEAAREGSRYAMVRGSSCTVFTSACPAAASDVSTYVKALPYPGLIAADMTVSTTWASYPSGTCTPSATCNNPGNLVKVNVQYALPLSIPGLVNRTLTMNSTSEVIISQ